MEEDGRNRRNGHQSDQQTPTEPKRRVNNATGEEHHLHHSEKLLIIPEYPPSLDELGLKQDFEQFEVIKCRYCLKDIKKSDFEHHQTKICPEALIHCEYEELGCLAELKRKDYRQHLYDQTDFHIHLSLTTVRQLRLELAQHCHKHFNKNEIIPPSDSILNDKSSSVDFNVPAFYSTEDGSSRKRNRPHKKPRNRRGLGGHECSMCGTKDTPQWRKGPQGPSTLCNACGLQYRKFCEKTPPDLSSEQLPTSPATTQKD
jgi:Zn ribbon nucleic-acid-binding protein